MTYRIAGLLLSLCFLTTCTFVQDRYAGMPPGPYRGVLELEYNPIVPNPKGAPIPEKVELEFDEITEGALPFAFDVVYEDDTTFRIEVHNGQETITVPSQDISWGRNQRIGRDTVRIDFPVYDSHIDAYYEENIVEGVWVVHYRKDYRIPFKAFFGKGYRFTPLRKEPITDVSGNWAVTFSTEDDPYPGVAEFTQNGNHLTGTFRTETGDYRYLEGTVQANRLYLSVFDGSHAFLFEARIAEGGDRLEGTFRSGRHYITDWTAIRDADAMLTDPDELTQLREDVPLSFTFPNVAGDSISLDDDRFTGKPKLISIFGTWCPNCRDEATFLKRYLAENDTEDLKVISLAFEQYGSEDDRSRAAIRRYAERMDVDWPILLAGSSDKTEASAALPMLDRIVSFPTLLFVDRNNRVRRVHTGFNGPATSEYAAFRSSFDRSVRELIEDNGTSKK